MSDELDRELRDFLVEAKRDRASGYTIQEVLQRLVEHAAEDARRFDDLARQLTSHRIRLENVETGLDGARKEIGSNARKIEETGDELRKMRLARDVEEITGSHHIPPPKASKSPAWLREFNRGALGWVLKAGMIAAAGSAGALLQWCRGHV